MTSVEKMHALRNIACFQGLSLSELSLLSEVVTLSNFSQGETIASEGDVLSSVYVVVSGDLLDSKQKKLPTVFGLRSVLFDRPLEYSVYASADEGVEILCLFKKHILTLIYECPSFVVSFLESSSKN